MNKYDAVRQSFFDAALAYCAALDEHDREPSMLKFKMTALVLTDLRDAYRQVIRPNASEENP